jgi:cullin 3
MLKSNQYEELAIMYKLYQRVPNGLSIIADCMSNYLREQGEALAIESGGRDRNISSLVQNLVDLKDKFDTCLKTALNSEKTFRQRIDSDFEYIINLNEHSPEYFSLFIDDQLMNGGKNLGDQVVEVVLDKAMMLLCYLKDKDAFEQYYKQHLAKRLLSNKPVSDDFEKYMLSALKNKFGSQFISKFESMVKDISLSNTISEDFPLYIVQKQLNLHGIDLAVRVLTTSVWPIHSPTNQCNLSPMVREAYQCFQNFYLSKHNGRLLTLQPSMGSADLTSVFYGKPKDDDTNGELLLTTSMIK